MRDIRTARLLLRPLRAVDLPRFVAYRRDPAVARYQSWDPAYAPADAERLLAAQAEVNFGRPGHWAQIAVVEEATGMFVGDCAACARSDPRDTWEVGVTFPPAVQGRGFATEALGALVAALFSEHGAHRVVGSVDERNIPAARLFERLGFRQEARLVEADWFKGEWATLLTYARLARDAEEG